MTHSQTADSQPFATAIDHVESARASRQRMIELWNKRQDYESYSRFSRSPALGVHEGWVRDESPAETRHKIDEAGRDFILAIKAAMDSAVHEAAVIVSGGLWPVPSDRHTVPLCLTKQEFDDLLSEGHLDGLRPDQVSELQALQPFHDARSPENVAPRLMLHLRHVHEAALSGDDGLVGTWVSRGLLEYRTPGGVSTTEERSDASGFMRDERRLGSCVVFPQHSTDAIDFIFHGPLDPVFNAEPWPIDCDDTLSHRTEGLLILTEALLEYLSRSATVSALGQRIGHLDESAPITSQPAWVPVATEDIEQAREVYEGFQASNAKLATYRNADGALILLRLMNGRLHGREIPQAAVPNRGAEGFGADIENATLSIAEQYALPDFVLFPATLRKGAGVREVGDGTIVAGRLGLAVQVKARETEPRDSKRETSWLQKKALSALKQARGTIRTTLLQPDLQLSNLRGRPIKIRGSEMTWVPVAVLDHPHPPEGVTFDESEIGAGVVLLRRDWDFLWSQLRSAAAVVDYMHRIYSEGNVPLGEEAARYYELADADAAAAPSPSELTIALGGTLMHAPKLPQEPAGSDDQFGHRVFNQLLEDIATSSLTGDEEGRLDLLGQIDRIDVGHRAQLGRLLLRRLDRCAAIPPDALLSQNRTFFVDNGQLHLIFSVYSSLTGYIRETYRTWMLVRRQDYLQVVKPAEGELPWTVAVLLTPRPNGERLWDTTVLATNGEAAFSATEHARLRDIFAAAGLDESPVV